MTSQSKHQTENQQQDYLLSFIAYSIFVITVPTRSLALQIYFSFTTYTGTEILLQLFSYLQNLMQSSYSHYIILKVTLNVVTITAAAITALTTTASAINTAKKRKSHRWLPQLQLEYASANQCCECRQHICHTFCIFNIASGTHTPL